MLDGDPKNPHPLSQSFGSVGGKLVLLFSSEPIFFVSISPSTEKSDQMRPLPKISKASSEYPYQQVS
jgi:hypothetical protein